VRDNGSGFRSGNGTVDGDGFLAVAAAPWSIRERTAAIGGSLSIWTQPGHGAEIAVTVPTHARATPHNADRRMYA